MQWLARLLCACALRERSTCAQYSTGRRDTHGAALRRLEGGGARGVDNYNHVRWRRSAFPSREREEARRAAQEQRRREREHESREEETAGHFSREFADAVHGNQLPLLHPSLETSGPPPSHPRI